jgi:D-alanyl-D-alanine carboxypeptidase
LNNQDIGNLSVFQDGNEIYNRSFGQKAIPKLKFNEETKYHIGSITKMFTATLIWQLIEENKITADTKLAKYYPLIPNAEKISITNLLEHSSGLADYVSFEDGKRWIEEKRTDSEIIDKIRTQGSIFEPGQKIQYSNSAYYFLAKIIEKERNCSYNKALRKYIIKPFDLDLTFKNSIFNKNYFKSYQFVHDWEIINELNFENTIGVGHLLATPHNLNKFLSAFFNFKIISKESVEKMLPIENKEIFGRGLMAVNYYQKRYFGHGGTTEGTNSMAIYNREDKIALSFSINALRYSDDDFLVAILEILNGKEVPNPKFFQRVIANDALLNQFTGNYKNEKDSIEFKFFIKNNLLYGQATGEDHILFEYAGDNKFVLESADIIIEFKPIENQLILKQGGETTIYHKEMN